MAGLLQKHRPSPRRFFLFAMPSMMCLCGDWGSSNTCIGLRDDAVQVRARARSWGSRKWPLTQQTNSRTRSLYL